MPNEKRRLTLAVANQNSQANGAAAVHAKKHLTVALGLDQAHLDDINTDNLGGL